MCFHFILVKLNVETMTIRTVTACFVPSLTNSDTSPLPNMIISIISIIKTPKGNNDHEAVVEERRKERGNEIMKPLINQIRKLNAIVV